MTQLFLLGYTMHNWLDGKTCCEPGVFRKTPSQEEKPILCFLHNPDNKAKQQMKSQLGETIMSLVDVTKYCQSMT